MSQTQNPRKVEANQAFATARNIKGSAQKAQLVLAMIRGKKVEKALNELSFCRKKLAEPTKKVLQSAIANAENNHGLSVDKLVVAHAMAEKGMVQKRFHARARGRAASVLKVWCHLTIVVAEAAEKPKAEKAEGKKAKEAKPAAKKAAPKAVAKVEAKAEAAPQQESTESKE
jgi:large subunit ribosomal protein L22